MRRTRIFLFAMVGLLALMSACGSDDSGRINDSAGTPSVQTCEQNPLQQKCHDELPTDPNGPNCDAAHCGSTGDDSGDYHSLCDGEVRDISGTYFMALQQDLSPEDIIFLQLTIDHGDTSDHVYTIIVQPLKTNTTSDGTPREDARSPAGEPTVLQNVVLADDGTLDLRILNLQLNGDANAISGVNVLTDVQLTASACASNGDYICGTGALDIKQPVSMPSLNASFGAIETDHIDADSTTPANCGTIPSPDAPDDGACKTDADCEAFACDLSRSQCRTSCTDDADCSEGYSCNDALQCEDTDWTDG